VAELLYSINEQRVQRMVIRVPPAGVWIVEEADFDQPLPAKSLVGAAQVRVGPLSLLGTFDPARTGIFLLQSRCRIFGGAGGWCKDVGELQYHDDGMGVRARDVIEALAREVGERMGSLPDASVRFSPDYVRRAGRAKDVLSLLIGKTPWWVDYAGITQIGTRPEIEVTGEYELLEFDARWQIATITCDDMTAIGIGSVLRQRLDVPRVVREMWIEVSDSQVRLRCYCPDLALSDSRLFTLIQAYVRECLPELPYLATYRYRVNTDNAGDHRWKLQAVSGTLGLPDIEPVSVHPGVAGVVAKLEQGTQVLVEFVEGNPSSPIITHFAAADDSGFMPIELALQASGDLKLMAGNTGVSSTEHATSVEAIVNLFDAFCEAINTAMPAYVTGAGLLAAKATIINEAIAAAAATVTGDITPYATAIAAALAAKVPNVDGKKPSVGWPNVRGG
jgi:hypothetical protein